MYELYHFTSWCPSPTKWSPCHYYSIYDFHNIPLTQSFIHHLNGIAARLENYYALLYWTVLLLSLYGLMLTFLEFCYVARGHKATHSFRVHRYNVFPADFRRRVRLTGTVITMVLLGAMVQGVLQMKPELMTPWLVMQLIVISLEIFLWFCDCWSAEERMSLRTIVAFVFACMFWVCVWCVRQTFIVANMQGRRKGMALLVDE